MAGEYRGVLQSAGGELAFPIQINTRGDSLSAFVVNGADTVRFNVAKIKDDSLILGFDYYDSYLRAEVQMGGSLAGYWRRPDTGGDEVKMDFSAQKGITYRYPQTDPDGYPFDGDWQATFTDNEETFPAHGSFTSQPGGKLVGTFQTETGDYRFLDGVYTDSTFTLSTFDGSKAFLFKARLQQDGTLEGDFWSKDSYHATWSAKRGENRLTDPLQVMADKAIGNKATFSFPDTDGDTVSTTDEKFTNKPMLVYLFGSWCTNCADQAKLLRQMYNEQLQSTDLQIVGLAFEYRGNYKKDAQMVRRYKQRFDIPWPLLIAGQSDKDKAAESLPFLNKVLSYPTTIFVNKNHRINAIHVGFNGPATGSAYYNEIQRFKRHINEIL